MPTPRQIARDTVGVLGAFVRTMAFSLLYDLLFRQRDRKRANSSAISPAVMGVWSLAGPCSGAVPEEPDDARKGLSSARGDVRRGRPRLFLDVTRVHPSSVFPSAWSTSASWASESGGPGGVTADIFLPACEGIFGRRGGAARWLMAASEGRAGGGRREEDIELGY